MKRIIDVFCCKYIAKNSFNFKTISIGVVFVFFNFLFLNPVNLWAFSYEDFGINNVNNSLNSGVGYFKSGQIFALQNPPATLAIPGVMFENNLDLRDGGQTFVARSLASILLDFFGLSTGVTYRDIYNQDLVYKTSRQTIQISNPTVLNSEKNILNRPAYISGGISKDYFDKNISDLREEILALKEHEIKQTNAIYDSIERNNKNHEEDSVVGGNTSNNITSTSDLTEGSNLFYTDSRVNSYLNSSTTVVKSYADNTFTGINNFTNSATTTFVGPIQAPCFTVDGINCVTGTGGSSQWTTTGSNIYYNTGNIGLGTTSPFAKLSVAGDGFFGGNLTATGTLTVTSTTTTSGLSVGTLSGLLWGTNGTVSAISTSSLFIAQDGNVGIGSTTPSSKLSVSGSAYIGGNFTATGTTRLLGSLYLGNMNGPLQAINGLISTSSTLAISYGGTGSTNIIEAQQNLGIAGGVLVKHADGSQTVYTPSSDDNQMRGLALSNAVSNIATGDKIILSCNVFDLDYYGAGLDLSDLGTVTNTSIEGCGKYSTTITTSAMGGIHIITLANNSSVSNLSIIETGTGDYAFPIYGGGVQNVVISNVSISAYSDGLFFDGESTVNVHNTNIISAWDSVVLTSGTLNIYDSKIIGDDQSISNTGIIASGNTPAHPAYVNIYNTDIDQRTSNGVGIIAQSADAYYTIYGGSIKANNTSIFNGSGGTVSISANTIYDPAKVNGPLTYLDSNQIAKSLANASINIGIGSSSPTSRLTVSGNGFFGGNLTATGTLTISGTTTLSPSLNGLLWSTNGVVSAVSTSSLGIIGGSSQWTTTGSDIYYNTGKVGVGINSPVAYLHVTGNADLPQIIAQESTVVTYDPTTVTGLTAWLKADSLGLNDGNAVATWTDSTLNAHNVTQANENYKPIYKENIVNGKPIVRFDGSNDYLSAAFSQTPPYTLYVVAKYRSSCSSQKGIMDGNSGLKGYLFCSGGGNGIYYNNAGQIGPNTTNAITQFNIYKVIVNAGGSSITENNSSPLTGTLNSTTLDGLTLGALGSKSEYGDVDIAEILLYNGALSSGSQLIVGGYLGNKYAITMPGASSQTANIQEWRAANSTVLAAVSALGKFGIGTSSPLAKLDLYGSAGSTDIFGISSSTNARLFTVTAAGNVGIGTTSPGANLAVVSTTGNGNAFTVSGGNMSITNTGNNSAFRVIDGAMTTYILNAGGIGKFGTETNHDFGLASNNVERMRIANTGNVGIGTVTPWAKLSIQQAFGSTTPLFGVASTTSAGLATSSLFTVLASGNVGIGTSVPSTKLHVSGTMRNDTFGTGNLQSDASGNITVSSDERLKNIEGSFTRGLSDIISIEPILYKWKDTTGFDTVNTYAGFSAQNVKLSIPEAVGNDSSGMLTLSDRPILAALINATKELNVKIDNLSSKEIDDSSMQKIASSTASTLKDSQEFINIIVSSVKKIYEEADMIVSSISAKLAKFDKVETKTAVISEGLEMKDQATGKVYCVIIKNGEWDKRLGSCTREEVATTTVAIPEEIIIDSHNNIDLETEENTQNSTSTDEIPNTNAVSDASTTPSIIPTENEESATKVEDIISPDVNINTDNTVNP